MSINLKFLQNKRYDLISLYMPTYQISMLRVPVAFIFLPGRRIIIKKLPKNTRYWTDKQLGLFHIDPDRAYFINKTPTYFYDIRHTNPIDLSVFNQLATWAKRQGLFHIRKSDLEHVRMLDRYGTEGMTERQHARTQANRKRMSEFMQKINESKRAAEMQTQAQSQQRPQFDPESVSYTLVHSMFSAGYISADEAAILNEKILKKEITKPDDLYGEIDDFSKVFVHEPLDSNVDRVLQHFGSYNPYDVVVLLEDGIKIHKGLKNMRAKPLRNWMPATYILFGALAIIVFLMVFMGGGGEDGSPGILESFIPALSSPPDIPPPPPPAPTESIPLPDLGNLPSTADTIKDTITDKVAEQIPNTSDTSDTSGIPDNPNPEDIPPAPTPDQEDDKPTAFGQLLEGFG